MTKTQKVIEAAKVAYERYTELQDKIGREAAARISFEVLQVELEKIS